MLRGYNAPRSPGGVPERPKGTGCKPVGSAYGGSNPPAPTSVDSRAIAELRALAARGRENVHAERRTFEETAERLTRELPELEARARSMGAPDDDLVEWAAGKHAELFVALGQLDTHRERVIREVNELATSLLGEPTF